MLALSSSFALDRGFLIFSIAKSASKKIGAFIPSTKFFLLKQLFISINLPHVLAWDTVVMPVLVLLIALQICWINYRNGYAGLFVPSLAASFKPLVYHRMQSAEVFHTGITLVDAHLKWLNQFHFLIAVRSTGYSNRLHDFYVIIPRCYKDVNSFFNQLESGFFLQA